MAPILTQSHKRFYHLNEVFSCKAFHLGLEQATLDPPTRHFADPEAFDAANHVESKNYDWSTML